MLIDLNMETDRTNAFLQLFEEKRKILEKYIQTAESAIKKVNYQIEKFYLEEDLYGGQQEIAITKETNDRLMDRKIFRYEIIIGLLSKKLSILENTIFSGENLSELDTVNMKLDILNLKAEIIDKESFLKHYKERKTNGK